MLRKRSHSQIKTCKHCHGLVLADLVYAPSGRATPEQVILIRWFGAHTRLTYPEIGRRFGGIGPAAVGQIIRRESWKHLP